ncbi:unnamed protein product, partial [Nesidiocoris tenuis]
MQLRLTSDPPAELSPSLYPRLWGFTFLASGSEQEGQVVTDFINIKYLRAEGVQALEQLVNNRLKWLLLRHFAGVLLRIQPQRSPPSKIGRAKTHSDQLRSQWG